MMLQQNVVQSPKPAGQLWDSRIMMLSLDRLNIFIPQVDILTFEGVQEVNLSDKQQHSVGNLQQNDRNIPAFCLSDEFELLEEIPEKRSICVILREQNSYIGLLCNEIRALEYAEINIQSLPACMAAAPTPLDALFIYRQQDNESHFGMLIRTNTLDNYIRGY